MTWVLHSRSCYGSAKGVAVLERLVKEGALFNKGLRTDTFVNKGQLQALHQRMKEELFFKTVVFPHHKAFLVTHSLRLIRRCYKYINIALPHPELLSAFAITNFHPR